MVALSIDQATPSVPTISGSTTTPRESSGEKAVPVVGTATSQANTWAPWRRSCSRRFRQVRRFRDISGQIVPTIQSAQTIRERFARFPPSNLKCPDHFGNPGTLCSPKCPDHSGTVCSVATEQPQVPRPFRESGTLCSVFTEQLATTSTSRLRARAQAPRPSRLGTERKRVMLNQNFGPQLSAPDDDNLYTLSTSMITTIDGHDTTTITTIDGNDNDNDNLINDNQR